MITKFFEELNQNIEFLESLISEINTPFLSSKYAQENYCKIFYTLKLKTLLTIKSPIIKIRKFYVNSKCFTLIIQKITLYPPI